jgi:DNA topoisomerase-3
VRRFLAAMHPEAVFEITQLETTVAEHVFRTRGRVQIEPGWRIIYGTSAADDSADDDEVQSLPKLTANEPVIAVGADATEKVTQPPRRYNDASLLAAMETAGKDLDDTQREAMKDSGIGTPATRAAIIERLIDVGYLEREGRSLSATEKGVEVIRLLGEHPLTSPGLTGDWEHRLARIERGDESRAQFMQDIASFAHSTVEELDRKLAGVGPGRSSLGPCPSCERDVVETTKSFSCWSREDPGCGFTIWKEMAGARLSVAVVSELLGSRRTAEQVVGFKARSGRSFSAHLALDQAPDGKWRVRFDEPWAGESVV